MVFPPIQVYLDHPNWQQLGQSNHHQGSGCQSPQLPPPPPPPPPAAQVGGGGGSIRPGSMVDRARLAKLPLPEAGLKCPRCESANTKFCYFNNYSLSQPRHFCKTCRRYWTRGGSLRNVPVGGGSRRNKRSKSRANSKSSATAERQTCSNLTCASPSNCITEMAVHFPQPGIQSTLTAPLFQNLAQYNGGSICSNIGGFQPGMEGTCNSSHTDMGFHLGITSGGNNNPLSTGGVDQWRLPILDGLEPPVGLFPYQTEGVEVPSFMVGSESQLYPISTSASGITRLAPVKVEESNQGLNLSRQFLGISENHQQWGGNTWPEISGLSSSSTNNFL